MPNKGKPNIRPDIMMPIQKQKSLGVASPGYSLNPAAVNMKNYASRPKSISPLIKL